jgi:hypothetical protein
MKSVVFLSVVVPLLMAGCASHEEPPPAHAAPAVELTPPPNPFTKPLTSVGGKFGALPPVVQNTIRAEVGTAELTDVIRESTADRVYYRILFRESAIYPPLLVASDGSVLNPDLTVAIPATRDATGGIALEPSVPVTFNDLPPNVARLFRGRGLVADIAGINKEIWGTHVIYVVSFKDPDQNPTLYVVANGTILTIAP